MDCKHATVLLSQALDRPLTWRERFGLRAHLALCVGCRRTRAQFTFLQEAMRAHPWKKP